MKPLLDWKHDTGCRIGAGTKVTAKSGAKRRGQLYHRKVYGKLSSLLAPEENVELLVEPWFRCLKMVMMRQPDAVIHIPEANIAVVVEVKLNWKDGRDEKLIKEYLPIVKNAFQLDMVWPLLITQCLRGYKHEPLLGLHRWEEAMSWQPGQPTPLMLVP